VTYAADELFEEVAYVAYYLHWSMDSILDMEHPLRARWASQVSKINQEING